MRQKFFSVPFAVSGDQTPVADATDPSGIVTFTTGWGSKYSTEIADPTSLKLDRASTNYLFNVITGALGALQAVGVPEWIAAIDDDGTAFPYAKGAHVRYSSTPSTGPWVEYVSLIDANTDTPGATLNWVEACLYAATQAEVLAGTIGNKIVTPLSLAGLFSGGGGGSGRLLATTVYSCVAQTVTFDATGQTAVLPGQKVLQDAPIIFTTTGTLPTGISASTKYFILSFSNTPKFSLTKGGTAITFTGTGTGTHSIANAPYDKTLNSAVNFRLRMWGGGGAGGGAPAASLVASGGGAGGHTDMFIPTSIFSTPQAIVIGAAGVGANGAAGGAGGNSSFGSPSAFILATGGAGGNAATTVPARNGGTGGEGWLGKGTSIANTPVTAFGNPGGTGLAFGTTYVSGAGGQSIIGGNNSTTGQIVTSTTSASGFPQNNPFTAGGGGGAVGATDATANQPGGNGSCGLCIIDEYS